MRARPALVALALVVAGAAGLALSVAGPPARTPVENERTLEGATGKGPSATGDAAGPGDAPVAAEPDDALPEPVREVLGDASGADGARSWSSELSLEDEAARVLGEAAERGDCVLARAGYLDLTGGTWGCVTQGSGWAEVCVVWARTDGTGCEARAWRLDASELAARRGGG